MARNSGLGRGLGELFINTEQNRSDTPRDGSRYEQIAVDAVRPNPRQPREYFDEDELRELSESIKEVGLLQPIVVREGADGYELIMGERRLRASKLAGLATVPAIIRDTDDTVMLRDALLENLHRVQLNPLEEAAAYQQMLEDFGCSKEQLATHVQRSRPHISNTLRLLHLPPEVQRRVAAGVLSAGHARAVLMVEDAEGQIELAQRIVAEGLSVRGAEEAATLANHDRPSELARPRRNRAVDPELERYAEEVGDTLDTRVKVSAGAKRGKLTIEFADADDLKRIVEIISRNN